MEVSSLRKLVVNEDDGRGAEEGLFIPQRGTAGSGQELLSFHPESHRSCPAKCQDRTSWPSPLSPPASAQLYLCAHVGLRDSCFRH